ncbi:uncharacterized protein LOC125032433 isoform X2 [Penaeus chinensis]|uniref:uncharacterized protein LOC125032433 isoform X2 n=1 Tax=Penaeus chinensis TaxID=139456 RepID=UPI001FB75D11|nr:uncharacterized protein LOC125032433 isoform X2 [Penaeus chinensis]
MVGPVDTGELVRSLVRIPGSGYDKSAGSACLDLARVSTLAASVPVPQTLPPALMSQRQPPQNLTDQTKLGSKAGAAIGAFPRTLTLVPNSRGRKRSCAEEAATGSARSSAASSQSSGQSLPVKRTRIVYMTAEQLARCPNVSTVNTPSGPIFCMSLQSTSSNSPAPSISQDSLPQLLNERNTLRQQNVQLQQRLALYQHIFRNRNRLTSVAEGLGVKIP